MDIKQIVIGANGLVYGLGDDNRMHRWDYSAGTWIPYFKEAMAPKPAAVEEAPLPEGKIVEEKVI